MNVSSTIMQRIYRDVELLTKNISDSSSIKKMDTEFFEQIKESLAFIKEFVKYCVLKQRDHLNFIIEQASGVQNSEHVRIPTQFLIECIFLALLDLPDNVGSVENIITKINDWLPALQTGALKLVSMIESLLKSTCCFKRLTSIEKSRSKYKKPLILAKRHYFWSIDYEYLKIFVRYFEGIRIFQRSDYVTEIASTACEIESNKKNTNTFFLLSKTTLINSNNATKCVAIQSFPPVHSKLFESWKILVDRYKALMEIKHKRLNWILQSSFFFSPSQNPVRFDQLDFVKLVRFKNDNHKKSRVMQKEENKNRPSRTITKRLINIPMINNTNGKSSMEEVAIKVRKREPRAPPPSPQNF